MRKGFIYAVLSVQLFFPLANGQDRGPLDRGDQVIPAQVDLIYERGLAWLAANQQDDGSWTGTYGTEPGVVGLCVAAFLGHGEDPNHGPYAGVIRSSIDFILSEQNKKTGYIGSSMYNHAFATKALAESYGVISHPAVGPSLEKAVALILDSQKRNRTGGWRYEPDSTDADTTVSGCQIVSLFAARNAGMMVPNASIKRAMAYMASCQAADGSYGYTNRSNGKVTLTAIGSLCRSLAKDKGAKAYLSSLEYLKENLDYRDRNYPYYYEYYMSQALFHADLETWEAWNNKNTRYLGTIQGSDGSFSGNHGPAFSTAGALLSLALNYRYLPIYER